MSLATVAIRPDIGQGAIRTALARGLQPAGSGTLARLADQNGAAGSGYVALAARTAAGTCWRYMRNPSASDSNPNAV
ncbi:MAG: hypothetical protein JWN52_2781 [Actinomycetia bacterium]|nr:hypothetical protein [Actinomycetes bacterium]